MHPIIFIKEHQKAYKEAGITTSILNDLEKFSLIEVSYDPGYIFNNRKHFIYATHYIHVEALRIPAGNVKLTSDGQALFKIIDKRNDDQILSFTIQQWERSKCEVSIKDR